MPLMTIRELLKLSSDYLERKQIDQPRLNAEVLLASSLGTGRLELYLNGEKPLGEEEIAVFRDLVRRRSAREPLQYITGTQEFRSISFTVGPGVLIPRPETELLVERVLKSISDMPAEENPHILDLGTGSGIVAVSVSLAFPNARVCATDISPAAMAYALRNARNHDVDKRIRFVIGDWLEPFFPRKAVFHAISANPPYVAEGEWPGLEAEVRNHEPKTALTAAEGGMADIRRIITAAPLYLAPGGRLFLETAPWHTEEAVELMESSGRFSNCITSRDYAGRNRVVEGEFTAV